MKYRSFYGCALIAGLYITTFLLLPEQDCYAKSRQARKSVVRASSRRSAVAIPSMPAIKVPYRSWLPKRQKPRVILLCIHGLGLNSNSFDHFGRHMAASGIPTYAIDVRGFGQWTKNPKEAHMDFEACLTDVEEALQVLHRAYPNIPVFLVGESMGGAIAIQAASRFPDKVNGLVSSVPSSVERKGGFMKSSMIVVFSTATHPNGKVNMAPVIVDKATSDPALRKKIKANPLNRQDLSKKELARFEKFMQETHDAAPLVERTPVLILVAYKDKLVTADGSLDLLREMTTPQKQMLIDGNSGHLMLEEGQMIPDTEWIVTGWIRRKAGRAVLREGVRANSDRDKDWTTYQRQVNLMLRINQAQKEKKLSVETARELRKELSKIAEEKDKIRNNHTGTPGTEDMSSIEEDLTKLSAEIDESRQ